MASKQQRETVEQIERAASLSSMEGFRFGDIISMCRCGRIHVARHMASNEDFAVKVCGISDATPRLEELILAEVENLRKVRHEFIIKLESAVTYKKSIYMVMPLMAYRSCQDIYKEDFKFGMPEIAVGMIMHNVLSALTYLHGYNFVHRAIKGSHILISGSGVVVLSGFRFMYPVPAGKKGRVFMFSDLADMTDHLNWLSPEHLSQDKTGYSYNSDVYMVGMTLLELMNGHVPYECMSPSAILVKKREEPSLKLWDQNFLPSELAAVETQPMESQPGQSSDFFALPTPAATESPRNIDQIYYNKNLSKDLHNFASLCVVKEAAVRPESETIIQHRFIKVHKDMPPGRLISALKLTKSIQFNRSPAGDEHVPPNFNIQSRGSFEWDFE